MISVIIPTYKPENYIYECLSSLYSQTLNSDSFEVLVVLNGHKEPFYNQISSFLADKDNMHLFYTDKIGVSNARNVGIEKSKGDYISFIDDDDIVSDNYLEFLLAKADSCSIVVSNVYNFVHDKNEKIRDYLTFKDDSSNIFKNRSYLSNACCKLIPLSVIENMHFDENFVKGEDAIFMFSISNRISRIQKADAECIYYRRIREMSASRKKTSLINNFLTAIKQQYAFSYIYIKKPFKYNFFLYISRLLAVFKTLFTILLLFSCSEKAMDQTGVTHIPINNKEQSIILEQTRKTILNYSSANDGITTIKSNIDSYINNFSDGKWLDINYDNQQGMADWEPYYHLFRTKELAIAYCLNLSDNKEQIVDIINEALNHWRIQQYISKNWWFNSIAVCTTIGETLVLLDQYITDENWNFFIEYLDKLSPHDFLGANKIDIATYHFLRGVCLGSDSVISENLQAAYDELRYVDHDGVQVDGSSLSHDMRYIGGYGEVLFTGIIKLGMCTRNTSYALSSTNVTFLSNYFVNTYLNCLRGAYIDYIAIGRQLSRENYLKRTGLLQLLKDMEFIDPSNRIIYEQYVDYFTQDILPSNNDFSYYFWKADYLLQSSERYNISVGGTSTRIRKSERMNGENLLGSLLSLGTTSFRIIGDEYFNIFPVWDWSMIPGVTSTITIPPFEYDGGVYGKNSFSGGVSDGIVSSYAFELNDSGLKGKKGYYTTKNGIICLGNSLEAENGDLLHTCVDQCLYRGAFQVNTEEKENEVNKVLHNNIRYILLSPGAFEVYAENKSGYWSDINKSSLSLTSISKPIFTIAIQHSLYNYYAYMVIPNPQNNDIAEDLHNNIEILNNDDKLQALVDKIDCNLYMTFFSPGSFIYNGCTFSVDKPCVMLVQNIDERVVGIYLAEPTQLENSINVSINEKCINLELPTGNYSGSTVYFQSEK